MAIIAEKYPYYLAGQPVMADETLNVCDKFSGECVTFVSMADSSAIDAGIAAAFDARFAMAEMAPYQRRDILMHCVKRFRERSDELAHILCIEAGKPIRDSRGEVTRLIDTFQIAAEEAVRVHGEVMNLQISERTKGYHGFTKRVPVGPCSFITPFNFPLNLVAHKVAPAIAAGCSFVLKPASLTPVGALIIGKILAETDLPQGAFSILPCPRNKAHQFCSDERIKLLSFTGSPKAGWQLKQQAGKKKVMLELGGNAACVIDAGTDLNDAVQRLIFGAFYQSGQSCISVQRIIVHHSLYGALKDKLVAAVRHLKSGDPGDESTFIGPLISVNAAERLEQWIASAVRAGGRLLCGGGRNGAIVEATLLENIPSDQPLYAEEAFGPVAVLESFDEFDDALNQVNNSVYGLHAGVFTRDIHKMMKAWDKLEVGGVIIGDVPSWRADNMPYGGVKDSGIGREGVRFTIDEMTDIRTLVIRSHPV
jgi:acyl-CoA reductase-like NAD-dependent aldehyde dehydrogenase